MNKQGLPRLLSGRTLGLVTMLAALMAFTPVGAQPILPGLVNATSVEAAIQAAGAGKPQPSGYLSIQFDEITTPGPLKISVASELPGTTAMVLLAGAPMGWPSAANGAPRAAPPRRAVPGAAPASVYLKAWPLPAGQRARAVHVLPALQDVRAFTLLVQAQGKWFMAVREVKLAKPARQ
jgi:hypothetical protein